MHTSHHETRVLCNAVPCCVVPCHAVLCTHMRPGWCGLQPAAVHGSRPLVVCLTCLIIAAQTYCLRPPFPSSSRAPATPPHPPMHPPTNPPSCPPAPSTHSLLQDDHLGALGCHLRSGGQPAHAAANDDCVILDICGGTAAVSSRRLCGSGGSSRQPLPPLLTHLLPAAWWAGQRRAPGAPGHPRAHRSACRGGDCGYRGAGHCGKMADWRPNTSG